MESFIAAFLRSLGDVSPHTRRTYRNDLVHFNRWYADRQGHPASLTALAPMTVVLYKAALIDRLGFKPATARRRLLTLHRFGQWAAAEGLIADVPTRNIRLPETPRAQPSRLTPADVERVLRAAQDDRHMLAARNYAMLRLMADMGLRVGAVVALQRADLLLEGEAQTPALRAMRGRVIPLPEACWRALQAYLAQRPGDAEGPLFLSTRGAGLGTETVRHMVNKYARRAGLDPRQVSPRQLRRRSLDSR